MSVPNVEIYLSMKKYFLHSLHFLLFISLSSSLLSQSDFNKAIIDSNAVKGWLNTSNNPVVSPDGRFFCYQIRKENSNLDLFVLQSTTDTSASTEFPGSGFYFSNDSKKVVYLVNDSLFVCYIYNNFSTKCLGRIKKFSLIAGNSNRILYIELNVNSDLVIFDLDNGKIKTIPFVEDFFVGLNANRIIYKQSSSLSGKSIYLLKAGQLDSDSVENIWPGSLDSTGYELLNYSSDVCAERITFLLKSKVSSENVVGYFKFGMRDAVLFKSNYFDGDTSHRLYINSVPPRFTRDGRYIIFQLAERDDKSKNERGFTLDVWNHKDVFLQSFQLLNPQPKIYLAAASTEAYTVTRLTYEFETVVAYPTTGDYVVINYDKTGDKFWRRTYKDSSKMGYFLQSLNSDKRINLPGVGYCSNICFSPGGRFLLYFGSQSGKGGGFFCYNFKTNTFNSVSDGIPNTFLTYQNPFVKGKVNNVFNTSYGIGNWVGSDSLVLVYDKYDIWLINLLNKQKPICITNGFGRAHKTILRLTYGMNGNPWPSTFNKDENLLLTAFNTSNKYNGFYSTWSLTGRNPDSLTMGPWTFTHAGNFMLPFNAHEFDGTLIPIKAKERAFWLLRRQSATEYPNYYATTDFKKFTQLTYYRPQKDYNWLTADLISWKVDKKTMAQGILYKPENFDPRKKYPVIINYYQQFSHRLYEFPTPGFISTNINIPWFVSRGYIVLTPDIHFEIGRFGRSALESVSGAVRRLSTYKWIDTKRIGINGHSFGGFETNYLITHSKLFAAAVEGAGTSDWISSSLQLLRGGSRLGPYEADIGGTLWDKKERFIENSPIFLADRVTTPLLIFHSKDDTAVPWQQAVEFFVALRRLDKPVWMLQYDGQDHGNTGKAAEDFSIRITQFFDHFLKGCSEPVWMSDGIPARRRGKDDGLGTRYQAK